MLIDCHCHINSLNLQERDYLITHTEGDHIFIDVSIDYSTSQQSIELSDSVPSIYSSLGFHPFSADGFNDQVLADYEEMVAHSKKIVSIGEVGLDYKASIPLKKQVAVFEQFIVLAQKLNLPLIVHNRLADTMVLDVLNNYFNRYEKIIFHCFSQDEEFFETIIAKGGNISFSLNVLRKKKNILEALKNIPLEYLLLETDSPYMFIKGRKSSPLDIKEMYRFVCPVKNVTHQELCRCISLNVKKVFNIATD
jgi:TatD DNase family protein